MAWHGQHWWAPPCDQVGAGQSSCLYRVTEGYSGQHSLPVQGPLNLFPPMQPCPSGSLPMSTCSTPISDTYPLLYTLPFPFMPTINTVGLIISLVVFLLCSGIHWEGCNALLPLWYLVFLCGSLLPLWQSCLLGNFPMQSHDISWILLWGFGTHCCWFLHVSIPHLCVPHLHCLLQHVACM